MKIDKSAKCIPLSEIISNNHNHWLWNTILPDSSVVSVKRLFGSYQSGRDGSLDHRVWNIHQDPLTTALCKNLRHLWRCSLLQQMQHQWTVYPGPDHHRIVQLYNICLFPHTSVLETDRINMVFFTNSSMQLLQVYRSRIKSWIML